jgi:drug/metabolite transporter (DMT)-like permease
MKHDVLVFAFAMFIAGTIGVFVTQSGLDALTAVFFRCFIAAICLVVYNFYKGTLSSAILKSPELRYIVLGGVAIVMNWVLLFQAFRLSSITIGIVTYYIEPFFLIGLGVFILKEKIRPSTLAWTGLAFVGLLLIILNSGNTSSGAQSVLAGVGFALSAALLYAFATIMGKKVLVTPPAVVVLIQMTIGAVVLFPLANFEAARTGNTGWGYILTLGIVHTALLYALFYGSVRRVPTALIAPLSFIDPAVAILSDVVVYSGLLLPLQIVGIAAILLSAYFVSRPTSPALTG